MVRALCRRCWAHSYYFVFRAQIFQVALHFFFCRFPSPFAQIEHKGRLREKTATPFLTPRTCASYTITAVRKHRCCVSVHRLAGNAWLPIKSVFEYLMVPLLSKRAKSHLPLTLFAAPPPRPQTPLSQGYGNPKCSIVFYCPASLASIRLGPKRTSPIPHLHAVVFG